VKGIVIQHTSLEVVVVSYHTVQYIVSTAIAGRGVSHVAKMGGRMVLYLALFFLSIYASQSSPRALTLTGAKPSLFLQEAQSPSQSQSHQFLGTNSNDVIKHNTRVYTRLLVLRGGKGKGKQEEDENIEEEEEEEEEGDVDGLDEIDGGGGGGVGGLGPIKSFTVMWEKTPLMTQIYIGSSLAVTLGSWLLNKNEWPKLLHLEWKQVLTGLQFWRPLTAFLFFGPFGLNYILTIHFVWTYMAQLEKLNYNKPEEFLMMMGFGSVTLLIGYGLLGISPKFLGHNLSTFLVYIWARIFEGTDVNVMDLLVIKAELLPWFFCVQTLVLEGELPFADLLGIVVGHLYHYFSQKKVLVAPQAIKDIFESDAMKKSYGKFKDDFV